MKEEKKLEKVFNKIKKYGEEEAYKYISRIRLKTLRKLCFIQWYGAVGIYSDRKKGHQAPLPVTIKGIHNLLSLFDKKATLREAYDYYNTIHFLATMDDISYKNLVKSTSELNKEYATL